MVAGSQARLTGLWLPVCLSRTSGGLQLPGPPLPFGHVGVAAGERLGHWENGGGEGAGPRVPFIQQNLSNPFTDYSAASHAESSR